MTDTISASPAAPKPAFIIIAAILNFIMCGWLFIAVMFSGFVLLFGNLFGLIEFLSSRLTQTYPQMHLSIGLNVFMTLFFAITFCFFIFFLWLGIGLLRGHKLAWYFQVGLSILGMIGFPVGTVINVIILIFFFQPYIRNYFKV